MTSSSSKSAKEENHFWAFCYWGLAGLLAFRLTRLVSVYGVNILFADQWDVDDPLFGRAPNDWYHLFFSKHAHGEGLGIVLEAICNYWSRWDTRVEGLFVCCLYVLTFLVYTAIRRQFGPYRWFDLTWPVFCLTTRHYEAILVAPHLANGPVPALLIALTAYFWLIASNWLRDGALLFLTFLTIYTGYGCFWGVFTVLFFAGETYFELRDRHPAIAVRKLAATLMAVGMVYRFFSTCDLFNYSSSLPHPPLSWDYFLFVLRMFSHMAGLDDPLFVYINDPYHSELLGFGLLVLNLIIAGTQLRAFFHERSPLAFVLFSLASFTLIFTIVTSYGRLYIGLDSAYSSRYVAYMLPGAFALYLFLAIKLKPGPGKWILPTAVFILVMQGAGFLGNGETTNIEYFQDHKRAWMLTYLRTGSVAETDRITGFQIYPNPKATGLDEKLQFLRQRHLNLFDDSR